MRRVIGKLGMRAAGAILATSVFGSAGCAGHAPYPTTWPPLRPVQGQSCERVAGSYSNRGEWAEVEGYGPVYLTEMLVNVPRGTGTEVVTLSFPEANQLDFVITGSAPEPQRRSLSRQAGQFKCDGSTLVIKPRAANWVGGVAPQGVPVVAGDSVVMKVDLVEGCLIVTRRDKDFLWLPFPGWSTWTSWYRFCAAPLEAARPATGNPGGGPV